MTRADLNQYPNQDPSPEHQPDQIFRDPAHGVERRAIYWWMLQSVALAVPVIVIAVIVAVIFDVTRPYAAVVIAVTVLVMLVGVVVEPFWRFRVHRWEATDQAVYARSGWLVREWRAAPLSRVQTVDAIQGPIEQLLGLSTLKVTTASASGAIEIGGLSRETANRVAAELAAITEQTPGDAT